MIFVTHCYNFMALKILVKDIPVEVMKDINREQTRWLSITGSYLSQSRAVIKMLRDYKKCRDQNKFLPE